MIHVLTLNWNGLDKLPILFDGLKRNMSEIDEPWAWYVRDNGSTDGSSQWLDAQAGSNPAGFHVEVMKVNHNCDNFASGVNSLWRMANQRKFGLMANDYVLLLNNDIKFIDSLSLQKMIQLMKSDPRVGIVGARLLYNNTNKLQHAGVIFGQRYGNMPYHFRHQEESNIDTEKNRYFQAVTAACCFIRGSAMQNLDEKFSWAFEDIDLCLRIGKLGWKIAYCGATNINHEESASLKKNPVNRMFLQTNVKHFKEKWSGKYDLDHEKYLNNPKYNLI